MLKNGQTYLNRKTANMMIKIIIEIIFCFFLSLHFTVVIALNSSWKFQTQSVIYFRMNITVLRSQWSLWWTTRGFKYSEWAFKSLSLNQNLWLSVERKKGTHNRQVPYAAFETCSSVILVLLARKNGLSKERNYGSRTAHTKLEIKKEH